MRYVRSTAALSIIAVSYLAASTIGGSIHAVAAQPEPEPSGSTQIHAFRLYTGPDGNSHVQEGHVVQRQDFAVGQVKFETTAPHSPPVWHNDPQPQYVVTMRGTLKFSTRTGEGFILHPGDVLIAEDSTGTGHGWEMQGDEPWTRTYVILPHEFHSAFVVDR